MTNYKLLTRIALTLLVAATAAHHASASIVLSTEPVTATPGSSGSFDVLLTNEGPDAQNIAGFNFSITTGDANITFTDVTTATTTAPYIFSTSLFGPDIVTTTSGQNVVAGDLDGSASGAGTDVAAGQTFGLGLVSFTVDGAATPSEVATLTFDPYPATSLSDSDANNVDFTTQDGSITIVSNVIATPEPGQFLPVALGLAALLAFRLRKRQAA